MYKLFKKSIASPFTVMSRSKVPEATKVALASSEIMRRLKRTSTQLGRKEFETVILEFTGDMLGSGYTTEWIGKVVRSATKGYMRILGLEEKGMTARNRAAADTATKRRFGKLCGKKSCFKLKPFLILAFPKLNSHPTPKTLPN